MDPNSPTSSGLAAEIAKEPKESKVIIDTLDLSKYGTNRFWWFWRTWKANIIFLILVAGVIFLIYLLEELIRTNKCSADKTKASLYFIGILASSAAIYQLIWPHTKLWTVTTKSSKMTGWAALAHQQKIDKKLAAIKEKERLAEIEAANKPQEPPTPTYNYSNPEYYQQITQKQPVYQQPQRSLQSQRQVQPLLQPPPSNLMANTTRERIIADQRQRLQQEAADRNRYEQQKIQEAEFQRRQQMKPVLDEFQRRSQNPVIAPISLVPIKTQQPSEAAYVAEGLAAIYNKKNQETQPMLAPQPIEQSNESSWYSSLIPSWFDSKNGIFGPDSQEELVHQGQSPQVEFL